MEKHTINTVYSEDDMTILISDKDIDMGQYQVEEIFIMVKGSI